MDDVQGWQLLPILQQCLDHGDEVPHQGSHGQKSHGALLPRPHPRHHHRLGLHASGLSVVTTVPLTGLDDKQFSETEVS